MSRPFRIEYPDAWYHVINRARKGQQAFAAGKDYNSFMRSKTEHHGFTRG